MTTTSSTDQWKPYSVVKTGAILKWTATITSPSQTIVIDANEAEFDFSSNVTNSDITITVTSTDGFGGLTVFSFGDPYHSISGGTGPSQMLVKELDVSQATELIELSAQYNRLTSLDVSQNTKLVNLDVRGSNQLSSGIDISNNPLLEIFWADVTQLTTIDVSNNPLLTNVGYIMQY